MAVVGAMRGLRFDGADGFGGGRGLHDMRSVGFRRAELEVLHAFSPIILPKCGVGFVGVQRERDPDRVS